MTVQPCMGYCSSLKQLWHVAFICVQCTLFVLMVSDGHLGSALQHC